MAREITVYCAEHQASFDVEVRPQIECEIRKHALATDFPQSEYWDYCCDCRVFSLSVAVTDGSFNATCPHCGRDFRRVFVCSRCKVISYDSGDESRGKQHQIDPSGEMVPRCPGCEEPSRKEVVTHRCGATKASFFTSAKKCGFCGKSVVESTKPEHSKKVVADVADSGERCPRCNSPRQPGGGFCIECGQPFVHADGNRGTGSLATAEFGLKCSVCFRDNPVDSAICTNCGGSLVPGRTTPIVGVAPREPKNDRRIIGGIVAGIFGLCILSGLISSVVNRKQISSNNSTPTPSGYRSGYGSDSTSNSNRSASLPKSFDRTYTGTIGGFDFEMKLIRDGDNLNGTATTVKTDSIRGIINDSGEFSVKGFENGDRYTGNYDGRIYPDGRVEGKWTNPTGGRQTSFSLSAR